MSLSVCVCVCECKIQPTIIHESNEEWTTNIRNAIYREKANSGKKFNSLVLSEIQ